ncbi:MAG: cytochrome c oxidase assembly protein [Acidobacteriota bacterium]|nr:cytochrome c oxidase assembly protein [Acidobacteriota bacterium]
MSTAMQSVLEDWSLPVWLTLATVLTTVVYVRGWLALRKTRPEQFRGWRLVSFLAGMASLWIAIGSPLDAFADVLLSAHMVEHLILMSIVPPLVLMGLPVVPLLRGLPEIMRKWIAGPLLRLSPLRRLAHWLVLPSVAWLAMNITFLGWHVPGAYDLALENETVHDLEHLCFLFTSLLFWWCIVRPWPTTRRSLRWGILLYLVGADLVNTALSAFLAFCNRPVYTFYVEHPNPFGIAPLPDQILGAVVMWVVGSLVFLVPAGIITIELLQPSRNRSVYTSA